MNIKEFLVKYGTDTSSNFDLLSWGKQLKIPNLKVLMKDEIKDLKRIKKRPLYCIANYHLSNESGIHWVSFYIDKEKSYYFDSYGIVSLKEVKELLKGGIYSTFQIQ